MHYLGARLDIVATDGAWTVALSETSPESAPLLELVMKGGEAGALARITRTPLQRREGEEGYVMSAKPRAKQHSGTSQVKS